MSWSFFWETKVSCVVTLCKRGIESRATGLLYVGAVQVSFLKSALVDVDCAESEAPNHDIFFALLEKYVVQLRGAVKLVGLLLLADPGSRLGQILPAPMKTNSPL